MADKITAISRWSRQQKVNFDLPFKQFRVNDDEERTVRKSSKSQRIENIAVVI